MKIEVTADDIQNGKLCDAYCCPIALALKRVGFPKPSVGLTIWQSE